MFAPKLQDDHPDCRQQHQPAVGTFFFGYILFHKCLGGSHLFDDGTPKAARVSLRPRRGLSTRMLRGWRWNFERNLAYLVVECCAIRLVVSCGSITWAEKGSDAYQNENGLHSCVSLRVLSVAARIPRSCVPDYTSMRLESKPITLM